MISSIIKMKELTNEERKVYMGPSMEAARTYYGVDPFDDETLKLETFPESKQKGNTLPLLREYYKNGTTYRTLVCTDEQLAILRTTNIENGVCWITENVSEDVIETDYEKRALMLSEINMFFTETGPHSFRPESDSDADYYVKVSEYIGDGVSPNIPAVASFQRPPVLFVVKRKDRFKIIDPTGKSYLLPVILP